VKRWALPLVLVLACTGSAADHERLGDTAYGQGEYATALDEYRAASRTEADARVWAKLGAAALKAGEYREAAQAYEHLATADASRVTEAARGLEQVARGADQAAVSLALEEAVEDLRRLAPERVSPRYTIALVRSGRLEPSQAVGIGPNALAAAGDAAAVDQMLLQFGVALQSTTACADAADVFQAVLRRSRDTALRQRAGAGLNVCGVQLGLEALLVKKPEIALQWFGRVIAIDSASEPGRRALIGIGDARIVLGDLLGATLAFQDAMKPGASDSIVTMASVRLAQLGAKAATADSQ
jgi:tetratricopeptide (TPR) repeat protein